MKTNFKKSSSEKPMTIEQEISSIFDSLSSSLREGLTARLDRPQKGESCRGTITVFNQLDLKREAREVAAYQRALKAGYEKNRLEKPFKAKALVKYAFYPSVYTPAKLGSVAIYGDNVMYQYAMIRRSGFLFGHKALEVRLEMGIRAYVVVKLVA